MGGYASLWAWAIQSGLVRYRELGAGSDGYLITIESDAFGLMEFLFFRKTVEGGDCGDR